MNTIDKIDSYLTEKVEVEEIMKTKDGKIAVKWKGKKDFQVIDDMEVGYYLIYLITRNPEEKKKIGKGTLRAKK